MAGQAQETLPRRRRGGKQLLPLRKRDLSVAIAVRNQRRLTAVVDLLQAVKLVVHQPTSGEYRQQALGQVGNRREGLEQSEGTVWPAAGEVHGHGAAQRLADYDNSLRRNSLR